VLDYGSAGGIEYDEAGSPERMFGGFSLNTTPGLSSFRLIAGLWA